MTSQERIRALFEHKEPDRIGRYDHFWWQALVPSFIEAGIDCLQPLEVKAGVDVRELKRDFGEALSFMGNIDARLFHRNHRKGLEREIRDKVTIAGRGGGYVYHSDHSVPPGTDLDTYRFAMECVERYGAY